MLNPISKVSVALSDKEINIVNQTSEKRGLYNFSATLRQIVTEWFVMQPIQASDAENGGSDRSSAGEEK